MGVLDPGRGGYLLLTFFFVRMRPCPRSPTQIIRSLFAALPLGPFGCAATSKHHGSKSLFEAHLGSHPQPSIPSTSSMVGTPTVLMIISI